MNAITRISPATEPDALCSVRTGHEFRGKFLDKCSQVERWCIAVLSDKRASDLLGSGGGPHLLGKIVEAAAKLAEKDRTRIGKPAQVLKAPEKVATLLKQFRPYLALRSSLAHSTMTILHLQDGNDLLVFEPTGAGAAAWERTVFDDALRKRTLSELLELANQFKQQGVLPQTKPSQPPQKPVAPTAP
jgi:hypothetical protein